jgi:murein DD-endopeptidase MepM/ murein hydrolase activator NlpD
LLAAAGSLEPPLSLAIIGFVPRFVVLLSIPVLLALIVFGILFGLSSRSTLAFDPAPKVIGTGTPLKLKITNPHGVRLVRIELEQNGARTPVHQETAPANRWSFWRKKEAPREVAFIVKGTNDGKARLIATVDSNDLRAATDAVFADVEIITRPPALAVDGLQHYINQGGAEMVAFTPSGYWTEAGVRVSNYTFRSFPKPGAPNERVAMFVYPWDVPPDTVPIVYAKNPAGAEVTARFWNKVFPKKHRSRELALDDAFISKVISELDPAGSGEPIARFLKINGEMRRANNQALSDLRLKTADRPLWSGPFLQLANSKVESQFADVRTYTYKGKKVDEQVHLGFDLSVTRNVSVVAANDGVVVHAAPLGIYGNCVVLDHGLGLQSIYAHLSSIGVKAGDAVKKSQEIGKSGSTGLAGGDHLHYSMQIDGVQTTPVEWWDDHWIKDRILSKLSQ